MARGALLSAAVLFSTVKMCFKCRKMKPLSEFYQYRRMRDGHFNKCKACFSQYAKTHRSTVEPFDLAEYRLKRRLARKKKPQPTLFGPVTAADPRKHVYLPPLGSVALSLLGQDMGRR